MLCPGTRDCDQVVPGPALLVQKSILCTHFLFTIVRPYKENKYRQSKRVNLTFFFMLSFKAVDIIVFHCMAEFCYS